ncbi:serine/threonine-protein kinase Nek2-like isoform X2 [Diorhabda sublineata]|nr:serine/threonine-protein kinase Nek2-like isoform X2 [Diorhabda sublineata]
MSVNNYELISILDKDKERSPKCFKVKNKENGEFFAWNIIDPQQFSKQQIAALEETFQIRKYQKHPNLLGFYDLFQETDTELYYLVLEYCRHGSLKDLIDVALRDVSRICEEFLCKIIYQIALVVKTIPFVTNIDIKNIFFDENYNVKLVNFDFDCKRTKSKGQKLSSLGVLIYEICTFIKFKKSSFEKELKNCGNLYSKGFLLFINSLIKDNSDLKKNVDRILCNSTILLKSTHWNKYKLLIKITDTIVGSAVPSEKADDVFLIQMEKLREKELMLQKKEKLLQEREHRISIKENKLAVLELTLKNNIKKANEELVKHDQTLKCNFKKMSSIIERTNGVTENLDVSYVSCGDSTIVPTSKKLDTNDIIKPALFTRTLSEKRIKFKGHSPLKDIDFNRRKTVRYPKIQKGANMKITDNEWITCSDDTDKSSLTYHKNVGKQGKQLFHTYENNEKVVNDNTEKPRKWTEENKKHAFELLRLMNGDNKENNPSDVKHTYL